MPQHFSDEETATKIKGSPLYMAPEMLLRRKYDAKVDIWSVGIILYEALFGKAPYKSETIEEVPLNFIHTYIPGDYGGFGARFFLFPFESSANLPICYAISFELGGTETK